MPLIVDAHEDLAWNALTFGRDYTRSAHLTRQLESGTETPDHAGQAMLGLDDYLRAQVAACAKGATELGRMVAHYGLPVVRAYMKHVQDNAEEAVRRVIDVLKPGEFRYAMDNGGVITVISGRCVPPL